MPNEWLTLTEAADMLGISSWTARRWVRDGRLHAEVRAGPYGPQYYVPAIQVEAIQRARQEPLPGVDGGAPPEPARPANGRRAEASPPAAPAPGAAAALRAELERLARRQEERWQAVSRELAELRRELDELRRSLGAPPPGDGPENGRRRRRWLW